MENCHFSPFFMDFCSEIRKIVSLLKEDNFVNFETDSFIVKFSNKDVPKKLGDWRTVIKEYLKEDKQFKGKIIIKIKSLNKELPLERLSNRILIKLYMEMVQVLDSSEQYKVTIEEDTDSLLYSIKKR